MSATIPESMRLDDLLKATGYDCPVDLQGKTFDQATEGGGGSGSATAYAWKDNFNNIRYFSFSEAPDDLTGAKVIAYSDMVSGIEVYNADEAFGSYLKVSAAEFTVAEGKEDLTCTRYTDGDFTLWT